MEQLVPVLFISALAIYMQCNDCTVQCIPIIADHSKLDLPCEADGVRHPKQRLKLPVLRTRSLSLQGTWDDEEVGAIPTR